MHLRSSRPLCHRLAQVWTAGNGGAKSSAKWIRICFALVVVSCGNLSSNVVFDSSSLKAASATDRDIDELTRALAKPLIDSRENVGISVGVIFRDGRSLTYGFGRRALDDPQPPDAQTIFAVGSVTKSFTALLAYELVKQGLLSVHETVGDILNNNVILSPAAKRITVEQLIHHSSGLPRQPNDRQMLLSLINYLFTGDNIYRHLGRTEVFSFLGEFDPDPQDVGKFRYSNIGFGLLGYLLEVKMGKSLPLLFEEVIFRPLQLWDTTYELNFEQRTRLAAGHVGDSPFFVRRNRPIQQWQLDHILDGAAGLYSTVNDLLKVARYRMEIRDTAALHGVAGSRNVFHVGKPSQYLSFGWLVDEFKDDDIRITFQHGMISGYSAYIGIEQERGVGVVVLCNNFNWNDRIGHNLLLALARDSATQSARQRQ
jgi:CubicO group peptidase (beta-lactamase class C family)